MYFIVKYSACNVLLDIFVTGGESERPKKKPKVGKKPTKKGIFLIVEDAV